MPMVNKCRRTGPSRPAGKEHRLREALTPARRICQELEARHLPDAVWIVPRHLAIQPPVPAGNLELIIIWKGLVGPREVQRRQAHRADAVALAARRAAETPPCDRKC